MSQLTLGVFSDRVSEIMPVIMREFLKHQSGEFYRTKITMPQFVVLEALHRHGELNMTDMANFMNVTTAAMTGIVERLVRDGYVTRKHDPGDRRIIKICTTVKGLAIVKKVLEDRKKMTMKIFGMISQEERDSYLEILEHIRSHLMEQEG
jgi:DNA-binding MarR family transcriptional regulator